MFEISELKLADTLVHRSAPNTFIYFPLMRGPSAAAAGLGAAAPSTDGVGGGEGGEDDA